MMMWLPARVAVGCLVGLVFFVATPSYGQLSLDVEANEALTHSQSIDLQSLVVNNGTGPNLFRLFLRNEQLSEPLEDLYFRILIDSDKVGRIAEITQVSGQPFSLKAGQQVYATNNSIDGGLPGVKEKIEFEGELSPAGKRFINKLKGTTSLPADRYKIYIEIYRGSIGGTLLASTSAEIGASIVENTHDFYLLSPGDVIGSNATISTPYPHFRWQGASGNNYRLVVVEGRQNDSPQSLVEGALSTAPLLHTETSGAGSLVDYEILDIVLQQPNFQFPTAGVQSLEQGKKYYWRVMSRVESSSGVQAQGSEIWSFTLADSDRAAREFMSPEGVLGEKVELLLEEGYSFQSLKVNDEMFRGAQALQKLMELSRRAERGNVSIVIEER